jgi:membrane protease subunit (stomatin/prohibitin family)
MGLLKALGNAVSSNLGDQFKEYITCPEVAEKDAIVIRGEVHYGAGNGNPTPGVISDGSGIMVPAGMAMMIVDQGAIKDFTAEAGLYTFQGGVPTVFEGGFFKGIGESIKNMGTRFTYGGQAATDQRVYYINTKLIAGEKFGSQQSIVIADPVYGSVEVTYNGEYSIRVADPVKLVGLAIGGNAADVVTLDGVFSSEDSSMLKSKVAQSASKVISDVMVEKNVSFNRLQSELSTITSKMNEEVAADIKERYGLELGEVLIRVNATEEAKKIIQEMDADIAKTTRMGQVYSNNMAGTMAAATAESMKNASSNPNGAMMGFMGMGMAQQNGAAVMNAANGQAVQPAQGQPAVAGVVAGAPAGTVTCPKCGAQVPAGKFCTNCGAPLE